MGLYYRMGSNRSCRARTGVCLCLFDAHVYMVRSALKEVIQLLDQHDKDVMLDGK